MRTRKRQPEKERLPGCDELWGEEGLTRRFEDGLRGWDGEEVEEEDERMTLIEKLIERIGAQLDSGEGQVKANVGDLIRLMQWERELNPRPARKFVIEWIDPKPEAA